MSDIAASPYGPLFTHASPSSCKSLSCKTANRWIIRASANTETHLRGFCYAARGAKEKEETKGELLKADAAAKPPTNSHPAAGGCALVERAAGDALPEPSHCTPLPIPRKLACYVLPPAGRLFTLFFFFCSFFFHCVRVCVIWFGRPQPSNGRKERWWGGTSRFLAFLIFSSQTFLLLAVSRPVLFCFLSTDVAAQGLEHGEKYV